PDRYIGLPSDAPRKRHTEAGLRPIRRRGPLRHIGRYPYPPTTGRGPARGGAWEGGLASPRAGVPPGGCADGFTLVSAGRWFGVTEPSTVPPRVGDLLLASRLVDPLAQPRWSAHCRRPHLVHRPAFLAVPDVDDEDRLRAGVVHPDDAHRGASCQG